MYNITIISSNMVGDKSASTDHPEGTFREANLLAFSSGSHVTSGTEHCVKGDSLFIKVGVWLSNFMETVLAAEVDEIIIV